jgi:hypothetical protein
MNPLTAWMLWLATLNLGMAKTLTDLAETLESDE